MSSHQLTELTNINLPRNETISHPHPTIEKNETTISSPRSDDDDDIFKESENENGSGETARKRTSKLVKKLKRAVSFNEKLFPYFPPDHFYKLSDTGMRTFVFHLDTFEKIFVTFEDPTSSVCAFGLSIFMIFVIFVSALQYILSSDPSVMYQPDTCPEPACKNDPILCPGHEVCEPVAPFFMIYLDGLCVILFTVDYLVRITLCPWIPSRLAGTFDIEKWDAKYATRPSIPDPTFTPFTNFRRYLLRPMNLIDLVAILPFYFTYVSTKGASLTIFRILRLGRVLRITKAGKNNSGLIILINTLKRSGDILTMMLFYILLCVVVIAALVFQFERGTFRVTLEYPQGAYFRPSLDRHGEEVSPYSSLWATIYWSIVTGTTLGYGDLFPTTLGGRLISCFWIFSGVLILGLPISVIGSNFGIEVEAYKKLMNEKKRKRREAAAKADLLLEEDNSSFVVIDQTTTRGRSFSQEMQQETTESDSFEEKERVDGIGDDKEGKRGGKGGREEVLEGGAEDGIASFSLSSSPSQSPYPSPRLHEVTPSPVTEGEGGEGSQQQPQSQPRSPVQKKSTFEMLKNLKSTIASPRSMSPSSRPSPLRSSASYRQTGSPSSRPSPLRSSASYRQAVYSIDENDYQKRMKSSDLYADSSSEDEHDDLVEGEEKERVSPVRGVRKRRGRGAAGGERKEKLSRRERKMKILRLLEQLTDLMEDEDDEDGDDL